MIILENIKELLNKRIEDLVLRETNIRKKELIFLQFKEKKNKENSWNIINKKSIKY